MSMARSLLGLNSGESLHSIDISRYKVEFRKSPFADRFFFFECLDTEDEAWYPDEEYTEDSEYDHDLEDAENHASDDTWDVDELEVDGGSDASGAPDGPEFGKPSDFYPSVIEPVRDGVNLERSGSYGKVGSHAHA